jgi:hypothetical protein
MLEISQQLGLTVDGVCNSVLQDYHNAVQAGNTDSICLAKIRFEDCSLLQNHVKTAVYKLSQTTAVIDYNVNRPATPVEAGLNGITQASSDLA